MENTNGQRWPVDFDKVQKGDTFTPARLEAITGHPQHTDSYRFAVLKLREVLMRALEDLGRPATVAYVKGCLCVLTDEQASVYTQRQCRLKLRGHFRNVRRMQAVCIEKLSPEQRRAHERSLCIEGAIAASIRKTRRVVQLESHQRTTPIPAITK